MGQVSIIKVRLTEFYTAFGANLGWHPKPHRSLASTQIPIKPYSIDACSVVVDVCCAMVAVAGAEFERYRVRK